MKKKNLKLNFSKETVAKLQMNDIKGGGGTDSCMCTFIPTECNTYEKTALASCPCVNPVTIGTGCGSGHVTC